MKKILTKILVVVAISSCLITSGQEVPAKTTNKYNYVEAFAPNFYTKNGTDTRSASGQPGAKYWQNRADYQINVALNDKTNEFTGSEILTYTNYSPDKMDFLWIKMQIINYLK